MYCKTGRKNIKNSPQNIVRKNSVRKMITSSLGSDSAIYVRRKVLFIESY